MTVFPMHGDALHLPSVSEARSILAPTLSGLHFPPSARLQLVRGILFQIVVFVRAGAVVVLVLLRRTDQSIEIAFETGYVTCHILT